MATLSQLQIDLLRRLGSSAQDFHTSDKQIEALNRARKKILINHDIEDFIRETTIAFTSGVGSLPSTYLRSVQPKNQKRRDLWNNSTDEEYKKVSIMKFEDEIDLTWTVSNTGGTRQVLIWTDDTVTLNFRYVILPADMSASGDDSGFPTWWDDTHTIWAAELLLEDERDIEGRNFMRQRRIEAEQEAVLNEGLEKGAEAEGTGEEAIRKSNLENKDFTL